MTEGVLFVHAFPLDASMWNEQVAAVREHVPTVAVNLPGFGGTPGVRHVMTMADAAQHCEEEMDQAGFERAVVCGLSMGGYVAFELWRRHQERIAGLVLANTRAEPDTEEGKKRRREIAELALSEGSAAIARAMETTLYGTAPEELKRVLDAMVEAQPPEAIAAASLGMAERPDSRPDLPTIDVPTLVITGSADPLIPPEVTRGIADAVPDAELAVIDGAGHLSNMERPREFDRLLEQHLRRCGLV